MCVSVVSHISLANPDPHFSQSDTCNNSTKGCCNLNCLQCFEILRLKRGKSKVFTLCVPKLLHQAWVHWSRKTLQHGFCGSPGTRG